MRALTSFALLFALACGGAEVEHDEDDTGDEEVTDAPVPPMATVEVGPDGDPRVNGSTQTVSEPSICTTSADCADGEQCFGEEGCDEPWTCQPLRPCTRDLVTYCSCSGETVRGSGSCPPEPYAHRGPC